LSRLFILWAGLAIGVAFLATPAKFLASSLSMAAALDVGRHTFAVYNSCESLLVLGLMVVAVLARHRPWLTALAIPGLVVEIQALWLLPALDQRVELILGGAPQPSSPLHQFYVAAEAVKIIALLVFGFAGPRFLWPSPAQEAL
jgi:hypothetical protein